MNRDAQGRFAPGNTVAKAGGIARARKLSRRRRKAIARKARRALVQKRFAGDDQAQREYMAALGVWAYEQQANVNNAVRWATKHPGTISEYLARRWQLSFTWERDFNGLGAI